MNKRFFTIKPLLVTYLYMMMTTLTLRAVLGLQWKFSTNPVVVWQRASGSVLTTCLLSLLSHWPGVHWHWSVSAADTGTGTPLLYHWHHLNTTDGHYHWVLHPPSKVQFHLIKKIRTFPRDGGHLVQIVCHSDIALVILRTFQWTTSIKTFQFYIQNWRKFDKNIVLKRKLREMHLSYK